MLSDVLNLRPAEADAVPAIKPDPILMLLLAVDNSLVSDDRDTWGLPHLSPVDSPLSAIRARLFAPTDKAVGSVADPVDVPTTRLPLVIKPIACTTPAPLPTSNPPSVRVEAPVPP